MARKRSTVEQPPKEPKMKVNDQSANAALPSVLTFDAPIEDAERPEPLPPGVYTGVIKETIIRKGSTDPNKAYFQIQFRIPPEQFPATYIVDNAPDGVIVYYRRIPAGVIGPDGMLRPTKRSAYILKTFLETIGAPMGTEINCGDWVGYSADLTITHEPDLDDVPRENITRITPASA